EWRSIMHIARNKGIVFVAALGLLALIGGLAFALAQRSPTASAPPLATERLRAAADRRAVNKTDQMIWDYQDRIRQNPEDVGAYATLGAAYLQRVRETGDPSYYSKAEAVFDEALKRDPQNMEALIGEGGLANARHQFRDALAIGERA